MQASRELRRKASEQAERRKQKDTLRAEYLFTNFQTKANGYVCEDEVEMMLHIRSKIRRAELKHQDKDKDLDQMQATQSWGRLLTVIDTLHKEDKPQKVIAEEAGCAPTVAPSGLGGGGGSCNELIVTWTPMAREYQNGDGFGYILAFRKKDTPLWSEVQIPHLESSRFVYYNESLMPYTSFEVKIKAYNRRGEGPFSQLSDVYSAEE
ncbi:hypothetical protein ATANTOWER_016729, partial [Ataeniobius toweri]|nr:hypothetical protein [Ataeniobius toweri]